MKKRILCFGDSNTWGYNGETRQRFDDDVRWTGQLQKKLGDDYVIIEEGLNGRTTVWYDPVEHVMSGIDYLWPCMKSHNPIDLVIINLGCNDCKPLFSANPWSIGVGMQRLVDMAMSAPFGRDGKPPKVLLMSPIHFGENILKCDYMLSIFGKECIEKSKALAGYYKQVAEESGCFYMDAASLAHTGVDGVHMDITCHEPYAEAMKEAIIRILG